MNRLAKYYDDRVGSLGREDFLKQVGHTEHGKPIAEHQFEAMVEQMCELLELGPEDHLLDLCCGNGVFTQQLAKRARTVTGVDFSAALIGIANEHHLAKNVKYHELDVMDLQRLQELDIARPTKILMYGALQHFSAADFEPLIKSVLNIAASAPLLLFGFVPEKQKKSLFYNTPKRKFDHMFRRLIGRDVMGTWWDKASIARICNKLDLQCTFHDVDQSPQAARYRFDCKIF